jgi:hypothetical protein
VDESYYEVAQLLPWTEPQIKAFLAANLAEATGPAVQRAWETLGEVHDLLEMAARPVTLSLLVDQLANIEALRLAGRTVRATDIYAGLVEAWAERDREKHKIPPRHKPWLMEELALVLWQRGERSIPVDDLEDWLLDELTSGSRVAREVAMLPEADRHPRVLAEDLRNATVIVRPGNDRFEFAHTSLLEYFVARRLARAVEEGGLDVWTLPTPSDETLGFLVELLDEVGPDKVREFFCRVGAVYTSGRSEMALRVLAGWVRVKPGVADWLRLDGWELRGARSAGLELVGSAEHRLTVNRCDFSGAQLHDASFRWVELRDCRFDGADLTSSEVVDALVFGSTFEGADRRHMGWYRVEADKMADPHFDGSPWPGRRWLEPARSTSRSGEVTASVGAGHTSLVWGVAFSHDSTLIATASDDRTARIWDPTTGQQLVDLRGHTGLVTGVAFNHDSTLIATVSHDQSTRIWDPTTGQQLVELRGHTDWVGGVGFNHDNTLIATASNDRIARIWDPKTGGLLRTMWGMPLGKDGGYQWATYAGELPGPGVAFDPTQMLWSSEAWRWCHLVGRDPETGRPAAYDMESLGPIRVPD